MRLLVTGAVRFPVSEVCASDTEEACVAVTDCVWCKSAAVGNSCFDKVAAARLPPAIFDCSVAAYLDLATTI